MINDDWLQGVFDDRFIDGPMQDAMMDKVPYLVHHSRQI